MSRKVGHRGRYDDTGEEVPVVETIPQINVSHSLGQGVKDGLPNFTLVDGTQLTPHDSDKFERVDNNRVISIIGD